MKNNEQDDLLSRLANKAKRKLNKQTDSEETEKRQLNAKYEYLNSTRKDEEKKLEKKIVQILKNNPDCADPIGRLIDHSVYDKLSEERKQAYILKLSKNYQEICAKICK